MAPGASSDPVARRRVLRSALQAMALDPAQREGRVALVRLLRDAPDTLPAEVVQTLEQSLGEARRRGLRAGVRGWIVWACTTPLLRFLGLRSPWAFVAPLLYCALGLGLSLWFARLPRIRGWQVALYAFTLASFIGSLSTWLGPFVLVPVAASTILFWTIAFGRPAERIPLIVLLMSCVAMPAALELLGLIPPSYRFVPDGLLLLPRALDLRPGRTTFALLWTSLTFIAVPALMMVRLRESLGVAERRLALQAWQLRQMTEDAAPDLPQGSP